MVRRYLSYLPSNWQGEPPAAEPAGPGTATCAALVPASERQAFDMRRYVRALVDDGLASSRSRRRWAREVTVGFARLDGQVVGVVGNNSLFKGGVLFVDSADKATRFVQLCDAFNVPLVFLSDVPGFMVGTAVEKQGIIRHGAKMITRDRRGDRAEVLRRRAQGLRRRVCTRWPGPGSSPTRRWRCRPRRSRSWAPRPRSTRCTRTRSRRSTDEAERAEFVRSRREAYEEDIDVLRLASELVVDAVVEPEDLRAELVARIAAARGKDRGFSRRRHGVTPV